MSPVISLDASWSFGTRSSVLPSRTDKEPRGIGTLTQSSVLVSTVNYIPPTLPLTLEAGAVKKGQCFPAFFGMNHVAVSLPYLSFLC